MAANKRKILESARKLAQKGAKEKALAEYQKLLKLDPKDAKLRLEIGDAHRRWGQVDEAVDTYTKVAEQYMTEGFDARAVAVFKQILSLDAERLAAYSPLAELYERMGLTAEAIAALQTAADGFYKAGDREQALELLRRMANVDPANTMSRIKVADLLRQEGRNEDAVSEYVLAAEELERQGDVETVGNVYRRILELDESHVAALGSLARNLGERGKLAEAVPLAERALQLDASNVERYEALAALYERLERPTERGEVYRRLADLYREQGHEDEARSILQRFVPAQELSVDQSDEISDDEFLDADGEDGLFDQEFPDVGNGIEPSLDFGNEAHIEADGGIGVQPGLDPLETDLDDPLLDEPLLDEPGAGPEIVLEDPAGTSIESSPPDELVSEDPQLEIVLDDPAEVVVEAGTGADEIVLDAPVVQPQLVKPTASPERADGPPEFDVEQLLAEASVYLRYGKSDKAIGHLEQVIATDPDHRAALEKLGEAFAESGEPERAVEIWLRAAKRASEDEDSDAVRVLRGRIAALDESAASALDPSPPTGPEPAAPSLDEAPPIEIDLSLDDDALDGPDDAPLPEADESDLVELDIDLPETDEPAADEDAAGISLSMAQAAAQDSFDGNSLSTSTTQQVLEDLEEADFYVQQGLHDEAEAIYQRVLSVAPNHPRALVRLGEVMAAKGGSPSAMPQPVPEAASAADSAVADAPASDAAPPIGDADGMPEAESASLDAVSDLDDLSAVDAASESALDAASESALDAASESALDAASESALDAASESALDAASADVLDVAIESDSEDAPESDAPAIESPVEPNDSTTEHAVDLDASAEDPAEDEVAGAAAEPDPSDTLEIRAPKPVVDEAGDATGEVAAATQDMAEDALAAAPAPSDAPAVTAGEPADSAEAGPPLAPGEAGDFDLAAALSDAFDDEPDATSGTASSGGSDDGFAAVFQAFKKGVSETLNDGDHQAHYDLAIAYKEMGLYDDAIHELRAAMADPGRTAECLHLIGLCAIDGDQAPLAVEHLEQLLGLEDLHPEQALAGRFDLGRSLQLLGDVSGARAAWEAVAAERPGFQDVEERIASLDAPDAGDAEPVAEVSEEFESFDDVMDAVLEDDDEEAPASAGESFDDLVAEANEIGEDDEPEAVAVAIDESELDGEPAPTAGAPEAIPATPASPATKARRKKKKISFV